MRATRNSRTLLAVDRTPALRRALAILLLLGALLAAAGAARSMPGFETSVVGSTW